MTMWLTERIIRSAHSERGLIPLWFAWMLFGSIAAGTAGGAYAARR